MSYAMSKSTCFLVLYTSILYTSFFKLLQGSNSPISQAKSSSSGTQNVLAPLGLKEKTEQKNCWLPGKEQL